MMSRFTKFVLSGVTAISLALTPMSAAAAPDGEDIAKTLAGLAILGLIANAANERRSSRSTTVRRSNNNAFSTIEGSRVIDGKIRRPGELKHRYRGARRAALPDRCVRILTTSRGDRTVYGGRCLSRDYIYASQLPAECKRQVRTNNNRVRTVYSPRCLRRDGWQVANN